MPHLSLATADLPHNRCKFRKAKGCHAKNTLGRYRRLLTKQPANDAFGVPMSYDTGRRRFAGNLRFPQTRPPTPVNASVEWFAQCVMFSRTGQGVLQDNRANRKNPVNTSVFSPYRRHVDAKPIGVRQATAWLFTNRQRTRPSIAEQVASAISACRKETTRSQQNQRFIRLVS